MKKAILTIVAVLTIAITPAMAQILILNEDEWNSDRLRTDPTTFGVMVPQENVDYDQYVPVGEGVILLAELGIAYLLCKHRKNENQ